MKLYILFFIIALYGSGTIFLSFASDAGPVEDPVVSPTTIAVETHTPEKSEEKQTTNPAAQEHVVLEHTPASDSPKKTAAHSTQLTKKHPEPENLFTPSLSEEVVSPAPPTPSVTPAPAPTPTPTPTPAPAPSTTSYQNEPQGFFTITEQRFASLTASGWRADLQNPLLSLSVDPTLPAPGSSVAQIRYPAGITGGGPSAWVQTATDHHGVESVYISFWLKLSENWQNHPVTTKVFYIWTHDKPVAMIGLVPDGGKTYTTIRLQDTLPEDDVWTGSSNKLNMRANLSEVAFTHGTWHKWEVVLVSNTGRNMDGEAHWWLNGTKVAAHYDVRYGDETQSKTWDLVAWRPIWGGLGGVVKEDMHMWLGHVYVSGSR